MALSKSFDSFMRFCLQMLCCVLVLANYLARSEGGLHNDKPERGVVEPDFVEPSGASRPRASIHPASRNRPSHRPEHRPRPRFRNGMMWDCMR